MKPWRFLRMLRPWGQWLHLLVVVSLVLPPAAAAAAPAAREAGEVRAAGPSAAAYSEMDDLNAAPASEPGTFSPAFASALDITPTVTVTPTLTPTMTPPTTVSPTLTPTVTPTTTVTPTPTVTVTPTATASPTSSPTATPTLPPTPTPSVTPTPTVPPTPTPLPPALSLRLMAVPDVVAPGEVVTFTVTVSNTAAAAVGLVLADTVPPGLAYVPHSAPGATYDPPTSRLLWPPFDLDAGLATSLSFAARATGQPGETLSNEAVLTGDALTYPLTATATVYVADAALIRPETGGVLRSADGQVRCTFLPARCGARPRRATGPFRR